MHTHGLLAGRSRSGPIWGRLRRCLALLKAGRPALLLLTALTSALPFPTSATTYYKYDILGRVAQVVESDGTTTTYTYDADGNITSIARTPGTTTLSITSISSTSGASGSSVTINGSGFSDIASQDSVTFNGVSGTITYASGNRIVVMVPAGATSGDIGITTPNGSTTSSSAFTVIPVAIAGFTPASGADGTVVTVTGSGFDPVASNDSVSLNGTVATVSIASATQLQFAVPSGAMAGHISVSTAAGAAMSSGDFFLPVLAYSSDQVTDVVELSSGGPGHIFTIDAASQVAVALFDGSQGQMMTLMLTNVSMGGQYTVYSPDGSTLASGNIVANGLVALPALPSAGTYSVYLVPGSAVGTATVALQTDVVGVLQTNGTPAPVSLAVGQDASYSFTGTAGESYSLELAQYTSSGSASLTATIIDSNGTIVSNCGSYITDHLNAGNCDFSLTSSGTYTVHLVPKGLYSSSFNILLNQDFTATLAAGTPGSTVGVSLVAGQHGLLTFSASAGQTLALYLGSVSITPASGGSVSIAILNSTGTSIASTGAGNATSATLNLTNLAAGTYSVLITPSNGNAGPVSMQAALAIGVTAAIASDGTTSSVQTYVPGQDAYLTMAGTAGQSLGLGLTQLSLNPSSANSVYLSIARPDGSGLTSANCYGASNPGCQVSLQNLPLTGNYEIIVSPSGQATMSFGLTASQDVSGTLTLDQSATVTLSASGQNGSFTFTTDGSQPMVLYVGSISTSPSGGSVLFYVYNSSGSLVAQGSVATGSSSINLGTLSSGTYTVLIAPNNAASATLQVTLQPAATGSLPTNGTSVNFGTTTPGQAVYINFSATSGQTLSLALTSLTISPSSVTSVAVKITNPDGSSYTSATCGTGQPGCEFRLQNMPQSGTYSITVTPNGQASTSFTATLSPDVSGSLTLGTPMSVNLASVGQSATVTFSISSQQNIAVAMNSLSLSPANSTLFLKILQSNGSMVTGGGGSTSSGMTDNLTNLAPGTYTVQVIPEFPVTGTLQLLVEPGAGGTLTPVSSGSGANFSTPAPGQNAYFTFSANAGDNDSIALSNLSLSPSSVRNATIQVSGPSNQSIVYGEGCFAPGCEVSLWNLPQTGTYTVTVSPAGQATMSFIATLSQDVPGELSSGTPLTIDLNATGQAGLLTFTTSSTQTVAINLASLSLNPSGTTVYAYLYNAAGNQVAEISTSSGTTLNLPNLAAGTYTLRLYPNAPATGSLQITLEPGAGGAVSPVGSGSGASYTTSAPDQNAYFTFSANAGDNDAIALSNLSFSPSSVRDATVQVTGPSNQSIAYTGSCYTPGCQLSMWNLPQTGTYTVTVIPGGQATMSFAATLSQDATGALSSGTQLDIDLNATGQSALLTFTTSSTQTVAINLASLSLNPSGTTIYAYLYNVSGSQVSETSTSSGTTLNLPNLAPGTYTLRLYPNAPATGSLQITLEPGIGGVLSSISSGNGGSYSTPAPGQNAYFTFSANAGDNDSIALTGLALSPTSVNSATTYVYAPNGQYVNSVSCYSSSEGCELHLRNLPQTGTYSITVIPGGSATMSFTATLSQDATGSLSPGTPLNVALAADGQSATIALATTATQSWTLTISSIATSPAETLFIYVYNASGSVVKNGSATSQTALSLSSLPAGSYTVVVYPSQPVTGTFQLSLQ